MHLSPIIARAHHDHPNPPLCTRNNTDPTITNHRIIMHNSTLTTYVVVGDDRCHNFHMLARMRGGENIILEALGDVIEHCGKVQGEGVATNDDFLGTVNACNDNKFHGFSDLSVWVERENIELENEV